MAPERNKQRLDSIKVVGENPTFKFLINSILDYSVILLAKGELRSIRYNSFLLGAQSLMEKKKIDMNRQNTTCKAGMTFEVQPKGGGSKTVTTCLRELGRTYTGGDF